jgi:anti-sigma factor RsiW
MSFEMNNASMMRCEHAGEEFGDYLDGTLSGVEMAALAGHLQECAGCAQEFEELRVLQEQLSALGTEKAPEALQRQLRTALEVERERGAHLGWLEQVARLWKATLAPLALRVSGGLAVAMVLVCGLGWMFGAPLAVQANDDNMAHLVAPSYLYSEVPPQPIATRHDAPVVVEAEVDPQGRVYDYAIVEGPQDNGVQVRVEENLLASVFKPATVFGVPVKGHVLLTYTGVSVKG